MANPMADEMRRFKGSDEKNPFEAMSERFDRAAQILGLDPDLYAVMRVPSREIKVYIPVKMDTYRFSRASACSTISPAGRRRAAFGTPLMSRSTR
jgi:hypothetical protein